MATERPLGGAVRTATAPDVDPAASAPPAGAWYLYMVRCRDGSLYAGISSDVAARVRRHNAGRGGHYTRAHRPVALAYWMGPCASHRAALRAEALLKRRTKAQKEAMAAHFARRRERGVA